MAADQTPADEQTDKDELLFALHHRDKSTLAFLEYKTNAKRDELEGFIQQELPEYTFFTIDVTPLAVTSLLRTLADNLPAHIKNSPPVTYVVNVHGLENRLDEQLAAQLNLERELLFRNVPYITLIWADAYFFRKLQRLAPDLWHWVTYKFRFDDPTALAIELLSPLPPERLPQPGNIAERQTRIQELKGRYEHLLLDDSDKKRLLKDKITILSLLGAEYTESFQYSEAEKAYETAAALQETVHEDDHLKGTLLLSLSSVYILRRKFPEALATLTRSQVLSAEENQGFILWQIGVVYAKQRQWKLAINSYQMALTYAQHFGPINYVGAVYHQLGRVYEEQQQWALAIDTYHLALKWMQRVGDNSQGATYQHIGWIYAKQQQWGEALKNYQLALKWEQRKDNGFHVGSIYHQLGIMYADQEQWETAMENYRLAVEWKQRTGDDFTLGNTYIQIGVVYNTQQQWNKAIENYQLGLEWYLKSNNYANVGSAYYSIGLAYAEQSKWAAAIENCQLSLEWDQRTSNDLRIGWTYYTLGRVCEEQKKLTDALGWFEKAVINIVEADSEHLVDAKESVVRVQEKLNRLPTESVQNDPAT
ncbi:MAG: tetratricopeptide repeat protein [Janthinobacterium lividum]